MIDSRPVAHRQRLLVAILGGFACAEDVPTDPIIDAAIADADLAKDAADVDDAEADAAVEMDAEPIDAEPIDGGAGPILYPWEQRHSPVTEEIAGDLIAIAARATRTDDVFSKIGDSITVSTSFMHCFAGANVNLDGRDALGPTIQHFLGGSPEPFTRESLAATVGWSAGAALQGDPSPLTQELVAIAPRFAVVMFGTNDVGFIDYDTYARNMTAIVDQIENSGTIPILSSIPPRDDDPTADLRVPLFNGIVRALAASRSALFTDYHRELLPIAGHGLAGDGVHPQSSPLGSCVFTAEGLEAGANVRNLITIEALDRARAALAGAALDDDAPHLSGSGTRDDPFLVPSLPFAHAIDTRVEGANEVSTWDACAPADESGPELRFRFHLDAPARITAIVASAAAADLDVHVVSAGAGGEGCLARDNREVTIDLAAGDYDVVADTYASGSPMPGEGFVVIVPR
jgi:hypothetical protein